MAPKAKKKGGAKAAKQSKTDKLRATRETQAEKKAPPPKRQGELAGFERKIDDELDMLGRSYDEQSLAMSEAQKQVGDLKKKIAERMQVLGIKLYRYHDGDDVREIRFKPEQLEIVKVKPKTTEVE